MACLCRYQIRCAAYYLPLSRNTLALVGSGVAPRLYLGVNVPGSTPLPSAACWLLQIHANRVDVSTRAGQLLDTACAHCSMALTTCDAIAMLRADAFAGL